MKRNFKTLLMSALLVASPLFMSAQQPPHPNGGNNPGAGNGPVGGGAPVGGGLCILLAMGIVYGGSKFTTVGSKSSIAG
jgi:hypothetical protein